jgi:serine/threonine protein kinase
VTLANGQIVCRRYQVRELLGKGGYGVVYRAWDLRESRECALKENLDTSAAAQSQFEHEAEMLGRMQHPNLPRVTDHFYEPGLGQYLVMDFVEGHDLREVQARAGGPLAEETVLKWARQTCDALIYLHSQIPPIIHRDIKPANLRLTEQGDVFLVDFGLAKVYAEEMPTAAGARGATCGYSPPEQYVGGRTDERTDLYALGATLYNLLTGQIPVESMRRLHDDPLPPPRSLNPAMTPHMEQVILRAMAPLRDDRFQTSSAMRRALGEIPKDRIIGLGRWRWLAIGIVVAVLILGACICGGLLWLVLQQTGLPPIGLADGWRWPVYSPPHRPDASTLAMMATV